MMCFLGPEGFPVAITDDPDGDAMAFVGVGVPGRLGDGTKPLLLLVPPTVDEEEDIPATLLTASPEATAATDATDPTTTLAAVQPLSSFLEPWNTALRSADLESKV